MNILLKEDSLRKTKKMYHIKICFYYLGATKSLAAIKFLLQTATIKMNTGDKEIPIAVIMKYQ